MPYKPKLCDRCREEFVGASGAAKRCLVCQPIARCEQAREYSKRATEENPERHRDRYARFAEKLREKRRTYSLRNREEIHAKQREQRRAAANLSMAIMLPINKEKITKALQETDPCNENNLKS